MLNSSRETCEKTFGRLHCSFPVLPYCAVFYYYREEAGGNCGFLALQDYEVTVLAFIAKDDIPWIVYFNYNGLSALIVKEDIQRFSLFSIRGLWSGNLFSQHVWVVTLWSVGRYCDGEEDTEKD